MVTGFVAVVGRPNVGKSSLVNAMVGGKVAIVSSKPQTTRNRIMGVVNREGCQVVLVDTPGVQDPRNKLGTFMETTVRTALTDVDLVLVVVDGATGLGPRDEEVLERAKTSRVPVMVALNKADIADPEKMMGLFLAFEQRGLKAYAISAQTGDGVEGLLKEMVKVLPEGPAFFPEDAITDMPEEFMCAEIVREKALHLLREEVPHGIGVALEKFMERDDGIVEIHCVIYCERKNHKGIIIGKNGEMLKRIGSEARRELEHMFAAKVFLQMYVKTREDWRNSPSVLHELGYE